MIMIDIYSPNPFGLSMPYSFISLLPLFPCHYMFLLIQIRFCNLHHTLCFFYQNGLLSSLAAYVFSLLWCTSCQCFQKGLRVSCHQPDPDFLWKICTCVSFVPTTVKATNLINHSKPSLINIIVVIWDKHVEIFWTTECFV